ncbi:hypothetical protein GGR57DRAFT_517653 [Xylariaceae sp. FL1272]|nr:hypothetical protein GGR57DRAFT_517653 [Xylariaceae sp. FL1272]
MDSPIHLTLLPAEILLDIGSFIFCPSDLLHLTLACRHFVAILLNLLYVDNIRNWNSSAIFWACRIGRVATVQHAGESPDVVFFEDQRLLDQSSRYDFLNLISMTFTEYRLLPPRSHSRLSIAMSTYGPARDHHRVWLPLHWALSCGRFYDVLDRDAYPSTAKPSPISLEIVAALLEAGADPNDPTVSDSRRGAVHDTDSHIYAESRLPLAMAACCPHVPADAVRLLLERDADPKIHFPSAGCQGSDPARLDFLRWLQAQRAHKRQSNAGRLQKLLFLMKKGIRPHEPLVEGYDVTVMFGKTRKTIEPLTLAQVQVADLYWEMPAYVTGSGVYALLDVFADESKKVGAIDGYNGPGQQMLECLRRLIVRLLTLFYKNYVNVVVTNHGATVDLGQAFLKSSEDFATADLQVFKKWLESEGWSRGLK